MPAAPQSIIDTRRDQMFPILESADIERVRRFGAVRSYRAGETLVEVGKVGPGLTILLTGRVDITQHDGSGHAIGGDLDLGVTARDVNLKRQITEVQKAGEEVLSAANRLSQRPRELRAASHSLSRETRLEVAHSLTKGTERVKASKPKCIYAPRIISDHIMVQEDFERLYKFLLESEGPSEVSDDMRKLVEQEWPELVHKLPPKVS
jgi:hypothetical protein